MTTWTRAEWDHLCGKCGESIRPGHAMQTLQVPGITRALKRCVACADGTPPPDLPPLPAPIIHGRRTKRLEPVGRIATRALGGLPLDRKQRAAGDD